MSREGGEVEINPQSLLGIRRKDREDEKKEGEQERVSYGIKKKIGIDASLAWSHVDNITAAGMAGPTSWALGDE